MQVKSIAECSKGEHSAILSTFIKLPSVIKMFALSIASGRFTLVLLYPRNACILSNGEVIKYHNIYLVVVKELSTIRCLNTGFLYSHQL